MDRRTQHAANATPEQLASFHDRILKGYTFDHDTECILIEPNSGNTRKRVSLNQRQYYASRAIWLLYRGEIPEGMKVCHTCDVETCVNIHHLFLGTHADNMKDMHNKGRGYIAHGQDNSSAQLNTHQIKTILNAYYIDNQTSDYIAEQSPVSGSSIRRLLKAQTYKSDVSDWLATFDQSTIHADKLFYFQKYFR